MAPVVSEEPRPVTGGRGRAGRCGRPGGTGTAVVVAASTGASRCRRLRRTIDLETLGVTRRQFLNRGILGIFGLALAGFGAAVLGFLWPPLQRRIRGKVDSGKLSRHQDVLSQHQVALLQCPRPGPTSTPTRSTTCPRRKASGAYSDAILAGYAEGSSPCTRNASTSDAASRGARARSGSSARATVRSTTGSARRRAAPPLAGSTASP